MAGKNSAGRYSQVCMVGDFNFMNIDWSLMGGNREAKESLKVIQDHFFFLNSKS